jgi:hypothetical protein
VAVPHQFQHAPANVGQPRAAAAAQGGRPVERLVDAVPMIVGLSAE